MKYRIALSSFLIAAFSCGVYATPTSHSAQVVRVGIYQNSPKVFQENASFWGDPTEPKIRIGIYQNPPKVFQTETGHPAGFWVDLLNAIAEQEHWFLEYIPCEWEQCLVRLQQGQLDLMVDVAYSEQRDRDFDFNREVVLASWSVVYTQAGGNLESVVDLHQKRVAVLKDSIQSEALMDYTQTFNITPQLVQVADFETMFKLLEQGKVDAAVVNRFFGQQAESRYRVERTSILVHPSRLHFVVAEGKNAPLLTGIDRQLRQMTADADSVYYQALERWLEPPKTLSWEDFRRVLLNLLVYVPLLGLGVFALWNYSLKREIHRRKQTECALKQSEQRFQNLAANVPGAIFQYIFHPDGSDGVTYMSPGCYALWEVEPQAVVENGRILWEMVHPEDRPGMYQSVMQSAQTLAEWHWTWRIIAPSGQLKWLEASGRPERRPNGDIVWDTLIMDVSDRRYTEIALLENEERLRLVTENMGDLVCLHDLDGSYLYATPSSQTLLGYPPEDLMGRNPRDFIHPDDRDRVFPQIYQPQVRENPCPLTYRIQTRSGTYIWLETLSQTIRDEEGQVIHVQTTSRDVGDRVQMEEQLQHKALHDGLTGLPNRSLLMERLDLALKRTKHHPDLQFAVLFLDLDHFKVINDSLGHLFGDELLLKVTQILNPCIRDLDLAARFGGDEFVILLEELTEIEAAVRVAEQILEVLQSPLTLAGREVFISASIGIVVSTPHYQHPEELLRDADLAMYRAKQSGRGQYALFDPALHLQVLQRLQIENDLRKALEQAEFVLYYQPIVALETEQIRGFEALIRWQHPQRGFISPGEFIAIAEETGLIVPIGHWILHQASQQLATWHSQFPHLSLKMSVNLSVRQLQPELLPDLDQVLTRYSLPEQSLVLEITESMLVQNVQTTGQLLNQIKAKGIDISIDDFGTGYSSLSYLQRLPVDSLKIDRAFVSPGPTDARNQIIAQSIIALSNLLELNAIAEGIETPQQLQWLKTLGCEFGQGFLFSPPLPAPQATTLLRDCSQKLAPNSSPLN